SMNSRIRAMLRNHRGLSLLKRIHAICWWCYLNTSKPRDKSWIVTHSFTSKRIEQLYRQAWERSNQGLSEVFGIPARYGTGVDWNEFHKSREYYQ
ncbi:IS256 family transposase, partial [Gardnerella vaginalis]